MNQKSRFESTTETLRYDSSRIEHCEHYYSSLLKHAPIYSSNLSNLFFFYLKLNKYEQKEEEEEEETLIIPRPTFITHKKYYISI
jgi:hypothetical protein